jgi:hypothetical protein
VRRLVGHEEGDTCESGPLDVRPHARADGARMHCIAV